MARYSLKSVPPRRTRRPVQKNGHLDTQVEEHCVQMFAKQEGVHQASLPLIGSMASVTGCAVKNSLWVCTTMNRSQFQERPIRVGDHLCRLIGKRLLVKFGAKIRKVTLDFCHLASLFLGPKVSSMRCGRGGCVGVAWVRGWWTWTSSIASGCSSSLRRWTLWGNTCLNWSRG